MKYLIAFFLVCLFLPTYQSHSQVDDDPSFACVDSAERRIYGCLIEHNPIEDKFAILLVDEIEVRDTQSGEVLAQFKQEEQFPDIMKWHPNGKFLATLNGIYRLYIWDVENQNLYHEQWLVDDMMAQFEEDGIQSQYDQVGDMEWSPDGNSIVFTHSGSWSVWNFHTQEIKVIKKRDTLGNSHDNISILVTWTPDNRIVVIDSSSTITVYDGENFEVLAQDYEVPITIFGYSTTQSLVLLNDSTIAIGGYGNNHTSIITVYQIDTMSLLAQIEINSSYISSINWNENDNLLAVGTGDWTQSADDVYTVELWDMSAYSMVEKIDFEAPVYSVAWNNDGSLLIISTYDRNVYLKQYINDSLSN